MHSSRAPPPAPTGSAHHRQCAEHSKFRTKQASTILQVQIQQSLALPNTAARWRETTLSCSQVDSRRRVCSSYLFLCIIAGEVRINLRSSSCHRRSHCSLSCKLHTYASSSYTISTMCTGGVCAACSDHTQIGQAIAPVACQLSCCKGQCRSVLYQSKLL